MKRIALAIMLCMFAEAQQTRKEIVNAAPTPADDAKGLSDKVPDVYAITGKFTRVEIWRFKFGTDLLAGIQKMVKTQKIKNGVILAAVGSVRGYQVHQVSNRDFPSKNMFVKDPTGPADVLSMNGYIANGAVHPHITLATPEHAFGGHLEPGTSVFTFAMVTVGVLDDAMNLDRFDDKSYR